MCFSIPRKTLRLAGREHGRAIPLGTKCDAAKSELFDHLISERKQHWWYLNSKRLGGLEVDHQLELDRHLNWKLARLLAAQDTVRIGGGAPTVIAPVISVG